MITGFFATIFYYFVHTLLSILPQVGFSATVQNKILAFFQYVYQYNSFFPIDEAIVVLQLAFVFFGFVLLFDIIKWLIHLIRGN